MTRKNLVGVLRNLVLVVAVASSAPAPAEQQGYEERSVSFRVGEHQIVAVLTSPITNTPTLVVLILHGTSGNRDGPRIRGDGRGLFEATAQLWAESGIASLRISTGRGGSQGRFEDMTLSRRTA